MRKIAYIELDTHAEIAGNFMELMKNSNEFSVDYYFSEKILKLLNLKNLDDIFKVNEKNLIKQISQKSYDLVIIGTAHRYFNVFKTFSQMFKTAIVVHNLNFSKANKTVLIKNIFKKDFLYRFKLFLKEDLLSAPDLYQNAYQLVLDSGLQTKSTYTLPVYFAKFSGEFKDNNSRKIIVIPGAVSQKRRNYLHIIQKIKEIKKSYHFVFLGKAAGKELEWLQALKSFNNKQNVTFFTEKVPQNVFDEWMKKADLLWCPIQKDTEFFSITEIYGQTKLTGNIGDAISFSKSAIFPKGYDSKRNFILNEEDDLENQFEKIIKSQEFNDFSNFKKPIVQKELYDTLAILIQK